MKSVRRKDGQDQPPGPGRNGTRDFHKDRRSNQTHASTTDPDARLARKGPGKEAKLSFHGHLLMENRQGLVVNARLTHVTGTAEAEAALDMLGEHRITVGADKAYDTDQFVTGARGLAVTPHVAQNISGHFGRTSTPARRTSSDTKSARSFVSASRRRMAGSS